LITRLVTLLVVLSAAACDRSSSAGEQDGRQLFGAVCARCHGEDGGGGLPLATGQRPRNFHDPAFQSSRSDADIRATIRSGKPPGMPSFAGVFSDRDLDALVQKVRSFGGHP